MADIQHHIYFASDFHLGIPNFEKSREREDRIVRWLESIQGEATELYLMGDLFDFWFEYKYVAPKGYIRLLGKLAEFTDSGIKVHLFTGNHDMWMFGYLEKEIGIKIYHKPETREFDNVRLYLAHGDGLGPGDGTYKIIKKIFRNRFFQWCYARLHPNLAFLIANTLSRRSRKANYDADNKYYGDDKEWLFQYCKKLLQEESYDYMVFGHRHLPLDKTINNSRYINLGDWIKFNTYGYFDGKNFELKEFKE